MIVKTVWFYLLLFKSYNQLKSVKRDETPGINNLECMTKESQSNYRCACKYVYEFNTSDCQSFDAFKCLNNQCKAKM